MPDILQSIEPDTFIECWHAFKCLKRILLPHRWKPHYRSSKLNLETKWPTFQEYQEIIGSLNPAAIFSRAICGLLTLSIPHQTYGDTYGNSTVSPSLPERNGITFNCIRV